MSQADTVLELIGARRRDEAVRLARSLAQDAGLAAACGGVGAQASAPMAAARWGAVPNAAPPARTGTLAA